MGQECFLHRMKSITLRYAFDRQDISAIVTDRKRQARIDPSSVENDRTGTALPAVAALFGSSQFQAFAQKLHKRLIAAVVLVWQKRC